MGLDPARWWARTVTGLVLALLVVAGGVLIWHHFYTPDVVHAFGRDYAEPSAPMHLATALEQGSPDPIVVDESGHLLTGRTLVDVPTVIYVKEPRGYVEYGLEGGP